MGGLVTPAPTDVVARPQVEAPAVPAPVAAKKAWLSIGDFGPMFVFFGTIYLILMLKVIAMPSLTNNMFFGVYSILITSYVLSRFILSYLRKPMEYDATYQPSVTFVVPTKNEEEYISETIRRFAQVDYPAEKLEVILVNDGSTDGTLPVMWKVADEICDKVARIEIVEWDKSKGKRHGMAIGARKAMNDIIIFVDSDSFLERDCVKHLTKYFSDPEVGAVSGHTDVYNRDTNLLTQMQALRYYVSFKIYKAAESVFGSVTCCPGCCSAYRREYLMRFLDEWLEQKFLGEECTFGDDRSLTNYMIRNYRAVYSERAKAYTVVPDTLKKYMLQQQRWKKSWLRETFIASTFMWRKDPLAAWSFYIYAFLTLASPIVFVRAMIWHPIETGVLPVLYLFGVFIMLFLHGIYYRLQIGKRAWFLALAAFWLNAILLLWQLPWALVTIRNPKWGTR